MEPIAARRDIIALAMTGEQMTLVLGLVVFGVMVVLLSRSRARRAAVAPHGKPKPAKPIKRRR